MSSSIVRISEDAHAMLRILAKEERIPMQAVLDEAVELYRRRAFLGRVNDSYGRLRRERRLWDRVRAERAAWDATLSDGLEEGDEGRRRIGRARPRSTGARKARRGRRG